MKIAIVKYNAGNVFSVECALRRLGVEPVLTADPDVLRAADKVVFPGVGEASSAMTCLRGAWCVYRAAADVPPFGGGRLRLPRHL